MPSVLQNLFSAAHEKAEIKCLPEELSKLEMHLAQPAKIHNIRNKMQKSGKHQTFLEGSSEFVISGSGEKVDPISLLAMEEHIYAAGSDLLLSEVLLFGCFHLLQCRLGLLDNRLPRVRAWFDRVGEEAREVMEDVLVSEERMDIDLSGANVSEARNKSLYKCDPGE